MKTLENTQLLEVQNWRYAVKKFDATKKIPDADWKALEQALILSPSSYGLQLWKFIVVENTELRQKLRAASYNQPQITDASHLIVFAAKKTVTEADLDRFVALTYKTQNIPAGRLDGYKQVMAADLLRGNRSRMIPEWTARQTYIALGNFMTSAALIGIDTCPMEGLEATEYDDILGLKGVEYFTTMACTVGYRAADDRGATAPKVRYTAKDVMDYRK